MGGGVGGVLSWPSTPDGCAGVRGRSIGEEEKGMGVAGGEAPLAEVLEVGPHHVAGQVAGGGTSGLLLLLPPPSLPPLSPLHVAGRQRGLSQVGIMEVEQVAMVLVSFETVSLYGAS